MQHGLDETVTMLVIISAGASLFRKAIRTHRRLRDVEDIPRSKVASAAQGLVELQGYAWPRTQCILTSEQKSAVYYEFQLQIERERKGKDRSDEWVTVFQRVHNPEFLLLDPTGTVLVDPTGAEFEMLTERTKNWRQLSKPEQEQIFSQIVTESVDGFPPSEALFGAFSSKFRIIEKFILRGSPLYASGDFRTSAVAVEPFRATGLTRFCEMIFNTDSKTEKNLTRLLDKNRDGKISQEEALEGYTTAATLAFRKSMSESSPEKDFSIYGSLRKSAQHSLFMAPASEKHLVEKMNGKPSLFLIAGAAIVALGIWGLSVNISSMVKASHSARTPSAQTTPRNSPTGPNFGQ